MVSSTGTNETLADAATSRNNMRKEDVIDGYAVPPRLKMRPLRAIRAVLRLLRNKEDTSQVFVITNSLSGGAGQNQFRRFVRTDYGKHVVDQPVILEEQLADFETLRALPEGSFGRTYLDFMESGGLTPEGIIDAAEESGIAIRNTDHPAYSRFFMHMDTSHDVWHVLTGYNRDALGEISLLVYSREQSKNNSLLLIVAMGALAMKFEKWSVPVFKALHEARQMGQQSAWLPGENFMDLLALPLEEVRKKLNLSPPEHYNGVPQEIRDGLLKPAENTKQSSSVLDPEEANSCC